jgi:hypothetical protein
MNCFRGINNAKKVQLFHSSSLTGPVVPGELSNEQRLSVDKAIRSYMCINHLSTP